MANPVTINLPLHMIGNRVQGSYPAINLDNSWRTASAYTPTTAPFKMRMVTLRDDSGDDAYHKHASQYWEYQAPIVFTGGRPPYRKTLVEAPAGATIGADSAIQTMTRTLDVIGGGVYKFTLPISDSVIKWQPTSGQVGQTFKFTVLIEDTLGNGIVNTHYVTVGESKFIYVDINAVDDSGAGTWAAPKKTFNAAHNNAGKICVYKTAGTYAVTFGGLNDSDNRSRQHLAIVAGVNFDMSAEQFGTGTSSATDVTFKDITFTGCVTTNPNCKVFNLSGRIIRGLWWGCKWRNVTKGTNGGDNPACMFFANLNNSVPDTVRDVPDTSCHSNIAVVGCDVDATVEVQLFVFFTARNIKAEKNTGVFPASVVLSNGNQWLNFKDSTSQVCAQFNVANGGVHYESLISFLNQRSWFCYEQECSYNIVRVGSTGGTGIGFNLKAGDTLPIGNVANGQRLAAEDMRVICNTVVCSTSKSPYSMYRWPLVAGMQPVIMESNIGVTSAASIIDIGSSNNDGYTLIGQNPKLTFADVDANMSLTGSARSTWLGKAGAEIASTVVS